jgi:hypothetical protein
MTAKKRLDETKYATDLLTMFNFFRAGCFYGDYVANAPDTEVHRSNKKLIGDLCKRVKIDMDYFFSTAQNKSERLQIQREMREFDFQGMGEIFRLLMLMDAEQRDIMEEIAMAMYEGRIKVDPDSFTICDEPVAAK